MTVGIARWSSNKDLYISTIFNVSTIASFLVACAVCPSCHKNSDVLKNNLVLISQRTTFAHWLIITGRSRYDVIHFLNIDQIIVSDVGLTIISSSNFESGSTSRPVSLAINFE